MASSEEALGGLQRQPSLDGVAQRQPSVTPSFQRAPSQGLSHLLASAQQQSTSSPQRQTSVAPSFQRAPSQSLGYLQTSSAQQQQQSTSSPQRQTSVAPSFQRAPSQGLGHLAASSAQQQPTSSGAPTAFSFDGQQYAAPAPGTFGAQQPGPTVNSIQAAPQTTNFQRAPSQGLSHLQTGSSTPARRQSSQRPAWMQNGFEVTPPPRGNSSQPGAGISTFARTDTGEIDVTKLDKLKIDEEFAGEFPELDAALKQKQHKMEKAVDRGTDGMVASITGMKEDLKNLVEQAYGEGMLAT